jgi:cell division protein FtsN
MSDQGFREIQLTGKQLVFLFMASVVLAVAIFLLGVSVGRGVRSTTAASAESLADPVDALQPPAVMPPRTELSPADLGYHTQLQGQKTPPSSEPAPRAEPPAAGEAAAAPPSAASPAPATTPSATPAAGVHYVQAGAFSTRANANRRAGELKAKGHVAAVIQLPGAAPFRVRLGPFADRAQADRLAVRLRAEGFDSSVSP